METSPKKEITVSCRLQFIEQSKTDVKSRKKNDDLFDYVKKENRARICKPFKEPGNRSPAWRNRFLGIDSWAP
jgi:hypothetical protein